MLRRLLSLCWISVFAVACGDDSATDPVETTDDDTEADDTAGPDDDDTEADDDTASFEVDGGVFEIMFVGEGVECGSERCRDATISQLPTFPFPGCCVDEETSSCGLDLDGVGVFLALTDPGCQALDQPGSEDPSCPDSPPLDAVLDAVNGETLPGCCRASGECGYVASFQGLGFGCVSTSILGEDESTPCTYDPDQ